MNVVTKSCSNNLTPYSDSKKSRLAFPRNLAFHNSTWPVVLHTSQYLFEFCVLAQNYKKISEYYNLILIETRVCVIFIESDFE